MCARVSVRNSTGARERVRMRVFAYACMRVYVRACVCVRARASMHAGGGGIRG